ncbi:zinc metalloprotease [Flavobacterium sp. CS20]|uniref:zinc metalloprotease n=1 Tax=Flavobacterium sp. CS20 TaxID=2775246 RepID=UPI001B3A4F36|nr:zinc metalloprotease [Flavobacterium sp. CS20]QTY27197.1 zinc metalloprotease [Flavobacterium sp. CS20]
MKTIKIVLVFFIMAWITSCSTDNNLDEIVDENEVFIYRIHVVVHVVHYGEPIGQGANISYEQVKSQIEVLNEDFRKMVGTNGYNDNPVGADTTIEFVLADKDPDGNLLTEPGIDRINGGRSEWPKGVFRNPIETSLKPTYYWDPSQYFNIWTINFGGFVSRDLLGYAQFPSRSGLPGLNADGGSAETDGVVIGYKYFGSSEKGDFPELVAPYDLGRTATHEVGHWLGLRHIWGDGDCSNDDYCLDTPNASAPNYDCASIKISCDEPEMPQNYMDYSYDNCMNIFTENQKKRMITVLKNSIRRKELIGY